MSLALVVFAVFIYGTIVAPVSFMRFCVRFLMLFNTPAERERTCKKSDRIAYYYLGTTGDHHRDARIRGLDLAYARALGIATVAGMLGMIAFAIAQM